MLAGIFDERTADARRRRPRQGAYGTHDPVQSNLPAACLYRLRAHPPLFPERYTAYYRGILFPPGGVFGKNRYHGRLHDGARRLPGESHPGRRFLRVRCPTLSLSCRDSAEGLKVVWVETLHDTPPLAAVAPCRNGWLRYIGGRAGDDGRFSGRRCPASAG
jgi:hypothetical protein